MLAWVEYQASLCPGCGHPKATAWHWDNGGYFTENKITCHACTAMQPRNDKGLKQPVEFASVSYIRDHDTDPFPPTPAGLTDFGEGTVTDG